MRPHHSLGGEPGEVALLLEQAAQIAVGKNAFQVACLISHGHHAQAFFTHAHNQVGKRRIQAHHGQFVARVHHVGHLQQQAFAQAAGRMAQREIIGREGTGTQQRHGQRVAQSQCSSGAAGGRETERAGFLRHGHGEVDVSMARQRGFGAAGHAD